MGEGSAFDVPSDELLTLFVVEWVSEPNAEPRVVLRQYLPHIIISDELSCMEPREHPLERETTSSGAIGEFQGRDEYKRRLEKRKPEDSSGTPRTSD